LSDQLLTRAGLRHLLETSGVALVGEVTTRAEAVMFAAREHPDVVVLDLDSRGETLACLEDLGVTDEENRVIVLSDRSQASHHPTLVELGAVGIVFKDERPETLIKAIEKVHAGELWLDRVNTAQVVRRMARRRVQQNAEAVKIATLTKREHEILALMGEGLKNATIAQRLFISEATVRNHLTSILDKLGVTDRFELVVYAFRHGLVLPSAERA
jgi:DNA-binding NarL/FixJ family response regulator